MNTSRSKCFVWPWWSSLQPPVVIDMSIFLPALRCSSMISGRADAGPSGGTTGKHSRTSGSGSERILLGSARNQPESEPEALPGEGLSCLEIVGCFNGCAEGERACLDGCFDSGSESGQMALNDLSGCMQTHNCSDRTCIDDHCEWEWRVCESDGGAAESGTGGEPEPEPLGEGLTCNEIFGCFNECAQDDRQCTDRCFEQGFRVDDALWKASGPASGPTTARTRHVSKRTARAVQNLQCRRWPQ